MKRFRLLFIGLALMLATGTNSKNTNLKLTGICSYYGSTYGPNRITASGEKFNKNLLTAAHKTLPFGTIVKVIRIDNKKEVTVRINDRGPFIKGRIIDVSPAACDSLGMRHRGIAKVRLEIVSTPERKRT